MNLEKVFLVFLAKLALMGLIDVETSTSTTNVDPAQEKN